MFRSPADMTPNAKGMKSSYIVTSSLPILRIKSSQNKSFRFSRIRLAVTQFALQAPPLSALPTALSSSS